MRPRRRGRGRHSVETSRVEAVKPSAQPAVTLAALFEDGTDPAEEGAPAPRMMDTAPLLSKWPEGYRAGAWRFKGRDVLISAPGKATLIIENAV